MNSIIKKGLMVVTLLVFTCMASIATASMVALHQGANDPTTEGWTGNGFGNAGLVEGAKDTGDPSTSAWFINDKSENFGSSKRYLYYLTEDEKTEAATGWALSARINLLDGSGAPPLSGELLENYKTPNMAVMVEFATDTTAYRMDFGLDDYNNPVVMLQDGWAGDHSQGNSYIVPTDGFHEYTLIFQNDAASLLVDGVEVLSGYTGSTNNVHANRVAWGAFFDGSLGGAEYNIVKFETSPANPVPVPGSIFLLSGGLIAGLIFRMKRAK